MADYKCEGDRYRCTKASCPAQPPLAVPFTGSGYRDVQCPDCGQRMMYCGVAWIKTRRVFD